MNTKQIKFDNSEFDSIDISKLNEISKFPCDIFIMLSKNKLIKIFSENDLIDHSRLINLSTKGIKILYFKKGELSLESNNTSNTFEKNYIPLRISTLLANKVVPFSIYYLNTDEALTLLFKEDSTITDEQLNDLKTKRIVQAFIDDKNEQEYQDYIDNNLKQIISQDNLAIEDKANIIGNHICSKLENVMADTNEVNLKKLNLVQEHFQTFIKTNTESIGKLIKILTKDNQTIYNHSLVVGSLSYVTILEINRMREDETLSSKVKMFDEYTLNSDEIKNIIFTGALLHDIGKIILCIEKGLMLASNTLPAMVPVEVIHEHSKAGYEHLKKFKSVHPKALEIVLQHEESCDGSGIPNQLPKTQISFYTQIISLANYYDNLTSKNSLPCEEALNEMEKSIIKFNKYLFPIFKKVILNIEHHLPS
ncbi:MAG: HD domain-containing protein [Oligoflexia bacterium]|nr:HD domain-containing protein [Oligoflexia bacterium]